MRTRITVLVVPALVVVVVACGQAADAGVAGRAVPVRTGAPGEPGGLALLGETPVAPETGVVRL